MRYLWLLPVLLLTGCYYPYGYPYGHGYSYGYPYSSGYSGYGYPAYTQGYGQLPPGYYSPGQPPPSHYEPSPGPVAGGPAYSGENCGTPDQPKPCRHCLVIHSPITRPTSDSHHMMTAGGAADALTLSEADALRICTASILVMQERD
jgi:hypothetical protein